VKLHGWYARAWCRYIEIFDKDIPTITLLPVVVGFITIAAVLLIAEFMGGLR
jgi:hypothetical protein